MNCKINIISLAAILLLAAATAQAQEKVLVVHGRSSTTETPLSDIRKLTFESYKHKITLRNGESQEEYRSLILRMTFKDVPTAAQLQYTIAGYPYAGTAHSFTVTAAAGVIGLGGITVYYEGVAPTDYTKQTAPPAAAGTYMVTADIAAGEKYIAASGIDLGNYTITPKELTVSGIAFQDKDYDGTTAVTPSGAAPSLSGIVNVDDVTLVSTGVTYAFASADAGTITVDRTNGYSLGGAKAGNYSLTQPAAAFSATISKAAPLADDLTFAIPGVHVYDGTPQGIGNVVVKSPKTGLGTITVYYTGTGGTTDAKTATAPTGAGTYAVTADVAADGNNFTAASDIALGTYTIGKAADPGITFPTSGTSVTYGQKLSESSLNGGDTQYGAFAWTTPTTLPTVTNPGYSVTFTPSPTTERNYETISQTTSAVSLMVNPKELTVSGTVTATKEYDGNAVFDHTHINIGAANLVGVVSGDESDVSISKVTAMAAFADKNVADDVPVSGAGFALAGSRADNYTLTQPTVTASITQATLTITPHAGQSKVYNTSEPTLTYTSSGWKGGTDNEALLTGALARDGGEDVNTYNILAGDLSAGGNYAISFTAGKTFEITKAPAPSITFPTSGTSITYGQTLSASNLTGGDTQYGAFAWTNPETVPTVTNTGYSVTFTPSDATIQNYQTISQTTSILSLMVNAKDIAAATVHIAGTYIYNGSPHTPSAGDVTVTLSGFGTLATVTDYTYTGVTSGGTDIGTATVTVTGAGNFTGTATGTFEITQDNYPVTVSSAGTGASIGGRYRPGAVVEIYAGTPPAGYRFSHWTATPDATFADAYSPRTTFTMPSSAVTVTAHFVLIPYYGIDIRPLNGGEVHVNRTSAEPGETVTLTVRTYAGYRFDGIEAYKTDDAETSVELQPASEPDTYTFTMPDYDVTVSPLFTSFDQATVDEAVEEIHSAILSGSFTVAQETANTQPEVRSWLVETINARIAPTGIAVTADDIVFYNFMAAIAGAESNPAGRNGSVRFRLTLKKGSNGFSRLTDLVGVIMATRYFPTGIDDVAQPQALKAYVREGMLHVSGLIPGEQWSVYNITGSLIYSGTANSEEASLGLSARGVYIVTTKTRQLKIKN